MKSVRGSTRAYNIGSSSGGSRSARWPRTGIVLLLLSGLFFVVNFAQEWLNSNGVKSQAAAMRQQVDMTNRLNAQLQSQLSYRVSKEYVISAARAYGMAMPGDTLMMVTTGPPRVHTVYVYKPAPQQENLLDHLLQTVL